MSTSPPLISADQYVNNLGDLPIFQYTDYRDYIKSQLNLTTDNWRNPLDSNAPMYGESLSPSMIPGLASGGTHSVAEQFKVESVAYTLSNKDGQVWVTPDQRAMVRTHLATTAGFLVMPIHRQYIEDFFSQNNGVTLDRLRQFQDYDFCRDLVDKLLKHDFIGNMLMTFGYKYQYTQALAYSYERARATVIAHGPQSDVTAATTPDQLDAAKLAATVRASLPNIPEFCAGVAEAIAGKPELQAAKNAFMAAVLPVHWSDDKLLRGPNFTEIGETWTGDWVQESVTGNLVGNLMAIETVHARAIPGSRIPYIWKTKGDVFFAWLKDQQNGGFEYILNQRAPAPPAPRLISSHNSSTETAYAGDTKGDAAAAFEPTIHSSSRVTAIGSAMRNPDPQALPYPLAKNLNPILMAEERLGQNGTALSSLCCRYDLAYTNNRVNGSNSTSPLPQITIYRGAVIINGQLVANSSVSHSAIQWSVPAGDVSKPDSYFHAMLRSTYYGLAVTGYIGTGPKNVVAIRDLTHVQHVTGDLAPNEYLPIFDPKPTVGKDDDDAIMTAMGQLPGFGTTWTSFWRVLIGLKTAIPPKTGRSVVLGGA